MKEFATAIYRGTQVLLLAAGLATAGTQRAFAQTSLLNVSYDPTRELYAEINPLFATGGRRAQIVVGGQESMIEAEIDIAADIARGQHVSLIFTKGRVYGE
jgi:ABC-type sulfate transport system substrate-binding protein